MEFSWILSPVTQYALMALGLTGSIGLCVHTQRQLRAVRIDLEKSRHSTDAGMRDCLANLEEVRLLQKADPPPTNGPAQPDLTLTRRAQILRMYRRGESVETITAALQIARNEVELMLKLNHLLGPRR